MNLTLTASPLIESAEIAGRAIDLIQQTAACDDNEKKDSLILLGRLIDCLPLRQDEYCYFVNRVVSTSQLIEQKEFGAATYQLRELRRKLVNLLGDRS